MIFNMVGSGGGLNFAVKAYASFPLAAAENTIGVITTTMTDWCLQADEPQNPSTGLVWIKIGTSSTTPISVSRTKTVMCYPIAAKEWNGSSWVTLNARCWQNGRWVDWIYTIVENGILLTDLTVRNEEEHVSSVTQMPSYVDISGMNYGYSKIVTDAVDLTAYTTITFTATIYPTDDGTMKLRVYSSLGGNYYENVVAEVKIINGTVNLDITSLTGYYWVGVSTVYNRGYRVTDWRII